jgi:hypothetical protein
MPDPEPSAIPADIRRRNLRLGLAVGGAVLLLIISFIVAFTRNGLPRDPAVWKRMQSHEQSTQP